MTSEVVSDRFSEGGRIRLTAFLWRRYHAVIEQSVEKYVCDHCLVQLHATVLHNETLRDTRSVFYDTTRFIVDAIQVELR